MVVLSLSLATTILHRQDLAFGVRVGLMSVSALASYYVVERPARKAQRSMAQSLAFAFTNWFFSLKVRVVLLFHALKTEYSPIGSQSVRPRLRH
ncbi:hypothetical protein [Bradyrhizobium sp.]|uniref:hypothetical protein n=1 Tax=Bradyrhizobium sp. TaxID=376 RepID=UPI0007C8C4BB|nr:hypothetical protein [Bradyrhizobium sp.]